MNNRKLAEKRCHYKRKFKWAHFCIYCGEPMQCLDHVFPLSVAAKLEIHRPSVRKELFQGLNLVPSCNECNQLAGASIFVSIKEKRRFIKIRLKKSIKKY